MWNLQINELTLYSMASTFYSAKWLNQSNMATKLVYLIHLNFYFYFWNLTKSSWSILLSLSRAGIASIQRHFQFSLLVSKPRSSGSHRKHFDNWAIAPDQVLVHFNSSSVACLFCGLVKAISHLGASILICAPMRGWFQKRLSKTYVR